MGANALYFLQFFFSVAVNHRVSTERQEDKLVLFAIEGEEVLDCAKVGNAFHKQNLVEAKLLVSRIAQFTQELRQPRRFSVRLYFAAPVMCPSRQMLRSRDDNCCRTRAHSGRGFDVLTGCRESVRHSSHQRCVAALR